MADISQIVKRYDQEVLRVEIPNKILRKRLKNGLEEILTDPDRDEKPVPLITHPYLKRIKDKPINYETIFEEEIARTERGNFNTNKYEIERALKNLKKSLIRDYRIRTYGELYNHIAREHAKTAPKKTIMRFRRINKYGEYLLQRHLARIAMPVFSPYLPRDATL